MGTTLNLSVQWTTLSLSEWRDDGKSVCAMDDTKSVPNGKEIFIKNIPRLDGDKVG